MDQNEVWKQLQFINQFRSKMTKVSAEEVTASCTETRARDVLNQLAKLRESNIALFDFSTSHYISKGSEK